MYRKKGAVLLKTTASKKGKKTGLKRSGKDLYRALPKNARRGKNDKKSGQAQGDCRQGRDTEWKARMESLQLSQGRIDVSTKRGVKSRGKWLTEDC